MKGLYDIMEQEKKIEEKKNKPEIIMQVLCKITEKEIIILFIEKNQANR